MFLSSKSDLSFHSLVTAQTLIEYHQQYRREISDTNHITILQNSNVLVCSVFKKSLQNVTTRLSVLMLFAAPRVSVLSSESQEVSAVPCPLSEIIFFFFNSLSPTHGGSESQSKHNITTLRDYLTACWDISGFRLSHLARLLFTLTPQ